MRVRILSGNQAGQVQEVDEVSGEHMLQFGFAERVPEPPPIDPEPDPVPLVEEPPAAPADAPDAPPPAEPGPGDPV